MSQLRSRCNAASDSWRTPVCAASFAALQAFLPLQGNQVFPLRRQQLRAIRLHQGIAAFDRLAGSVDAEFVDPASNLAVTTLPPLVDLHGAGGTYRE